MARSSQRIIGGGDSVSRCRAMIQKAGPSADIADYTAQRTRNLTIVDGHDFAARCEEWLCLSVKIAHYPGLRP